MTQNRYNMPGLKNNPVKYFRQRLTFFAILLLLLIMLFPSCEEGNDGLPGFAFVAFTWIDTEPEYIEIENEFIPEIFYWDWFYRVDPGLYYIYYEGTQRRGGREHPYAWELEYEVYENPGERGKLFWQDGDDGPDAYFTIECSPFGPEIYYEEADIEKSTSLNDEQEIVINTGDGMIVEKHHNNYSLRLIYKKVQPR